jgi:prolyl-tRNA synthetase
MEVKNKTAATKDTADKKFVENICDMETDFARWYTDVVVKAGLAGYSPVRGCMYVHPYGTAVWENIKSGLDARFRATGHENVMMPLFIPESLFQKEKDHIAGFAPEVAWVTHGGQEKLTERLLVRPTSEVLFCDYYAGVIHSWRDLPKLYNQWANIVRWEKTTRALLRTMECFWQEGPTAHETAAEAEAETQQMLNVYADFMENELAIPVIKGRKTDKEKFAGAVATYTIEAMMHDGVALQSGTSHYFGDGFARAFDIKFTGRDGKIQHPHQTSWGMTTRVIGGVIMVHGDNSGLVLPPAVAPIQVVIIPIAPHKDGVLAAARALSAELSNVARIKLDESDQSAGWKFAEYEMKGVPLRIEYGPRDIESGTCVVVRRDNREKITIKVSEIAKQIPALLKSVRDALYEKALARRKAMTYSAKDLAEIIEIARNKPGFIKSMWCGDPECELRVKEKAGLTSRCMPLDEKPIGDKCAICGRPGKHLVYWGKQY